MTTITRDEWLREFERVMCQMRPDSEGMTTDELARSWGCSIRVARERLGLTRNRLVVGRKRATTLDGRSTLVPCYRLTPLTRTKREGLYPKAAKKR